MDQGSQGGRLVGTQASVNRVKEENGGAATRSRNFYSQNEEIRGRDINLIEGMHDEARQESKSHTCLI